MKARSQNYVKKVTLLDTTTVEEKPACPVIGINSIRKAWWDLFMDLLMAFSVLTTLYFLGFDPYPPEGMYILDQLVRIFFIGDIFVIFFSEMVSIINVLK